MENLKNNLMIETINLKFKNILKIIIYYPFIIFILHNLIILLKEIKGINKLNMITVINMNTMPHLYEN